MTAPWRLRTARLDLVPFDGSVAVALHEVVLAELDHLRPWMQFAQLEPVSLEERIDLFTRFRTRFDGGDRSWALRSRATGDWLGACGLHPRVGPLGLEIGYWLVRGAVGRGLASEAVAAACHVAFRFDGVDRVEIRAEPSNARSCRVAERCGFVREAVLRRRIQWPGGPPRDAAIYSLFEADFRESALRGADVRAFDAADRPFDLP